MFNVYVWNACLVEMENTRFVIVLQKNRVVVVAVGQNVAAIYSYERSNL